jgi:hypothetical protein
LNVLNDLNMNRFARVQALALPLDHVVEG